MFLCADCGDPPRVVATAAVSCSAPLWYSDFSPLQSVHILSGATNRHRRCSSGSLHGWNLVEHITNSPLSGIHS